MRAEVSEFRWQVFDGGYVCQNHDVDGKKTRCLSPALDEGYFSVSDRYPMADDPALFRKFAAVEPTEAGIIDFANQWGPLRSELDFWEDYLGEDEVPTSLVWTFEPAKLWFEEIRRMNALVGLWDALKSKQSLADLIEVRKEEFHGNLQGRVSFKAAPGLGWNFSFGRRNRPGGGIRELARLALLEMINDSLWGACSPWLNAGRSTTESALLLTPHHLNAALWLMFAQEILGEKKLKQCQYCKGHFEISTPGNQRRQRRDRKYCSPKCRAAAFRERTQPHQQD